MAQVYPGLQQIIAQGISNMGAIHGGIDPITGKIVGHREPDIPYDEWLLNAVIKYGINNPFKQFDDDLYIYSKIQGAVGTEHLVRVESPHVETAAWRFTDKAKRYLDIVQQM